MEHHGNTVRLGCPVNDLQFFHAMQIVIGKEQLMRRMDLNHTDLEPQDLFHVRHDVGRVPRMKPAAGNEAAGVRPGVLCHPLIHSMTESNYFRRDVVDQHCPCNSSRVQIFQEGFRRMAEFGDLFEISALLLYQSQGRWLEHLYGLNVDMTIGDQNIWPSVEALPVNNKCPL